jgi:small subunit ribosomal protein S8
MSMTDPIADLLTRVRNGAQARKEYVECPWSVIKERIVRVMIEEGFLNDCSVIEAGSKKNLRVWLKYDSAQKSVIGGMKRVSRPSHRVYVGSKTMPSIRKGMGISIVSTPVGVLVDREAVRQNVGGEVLCSIW